MKLLKTPLRYPGGKSRAAAMLYKWFPSGITEYREPFLGGASMALYFSQLHPDVPIFVNDLYDHLYNFWYHLQRMGDELSEECYKVKFDNPEPASAKALFKQAKDEIKNVCGLRQATLFWVLNKCSYSGLTENSSFSEAASIQNFSLRGAEKLKKYPPIIKNWTITNNDYATLMSEAWTAGSHPELSINKGKAFVFLDPPYKIKSYLYGSNAELHKGFDHTRFRDVCQSCTQPWMVTYNVDKGIEEAFANYRQQYFDITYGMQHRANNKKQELLITNYDVAPVNPLEAILYGRV